ncbi:MAG: iron-sulfur cluster repair di-iron protein [Chitinophagales bacterium]|nr:iron-sulfur cluster repair di-iron protein [Chitinophagales bacterium]
MEITKDNIVGEVVANNYKTAAIFKANKIDFCCNGNKSIASACEKANKNTDEVLLTLNQIINSTDNNANIDFNAWDMDLLVDYIVKKHHRYVEQKIEEIIPYLKKVSSVHGNHHPELYEIYDLFIASAQDLTAHMKKEELILFPYINKLAKQQLNEQAPFGSVENPIHMMEHEHNIEGERFRKIAELSSNYTAPNDACNTYRVTYALLKEFEDDLHMHIHLENNILFPRAINAEKRLQNV